MKIALVLGSGGARGYAHVGVIEELEARGHEVVGVAGTSMGALVGGVYAAGVLPEFTDYVRALKRADVLALTDFALGAPGLIRLTRVVRELREYIGDVRIEDLPLPYVAVAANMDTLREVWFRQGPLLAAIRASISIPGVFTPVRQGDRLLVDGGLLNPLPMGPSMDVDADLRVGVSLFGRGPGLHPRTPTTESADDAEADTEPPHPWVSRLEDLFDSSVVGQWLSDIRAKRDQPGGVEDLTHGISVVEMSMRALDVMQSRVELARTAMHAPDVIVSVPMDTANVLEFHRAAELIDVGRDLAATAFDKADL